MNVEQFETLVYAYGRAHGVPFISRTDAANFREFVSRKVRDFVERTRVLYDDNVTFSLTSADTGEYDLLDTDTFSRPILEPEVVWIDGNQLVDSDGLPGLVTIREANDWVYNFRTVADGTPEKAFMYQSGKNPILRLVPAPDASYSGVVSGWVQHFDLSDDGTIDTTEMELPASSIDACAKFVAGELILVGAEGNTLQAAMNLRQMGEMEGSKYSVRAGSYLTDYRRGRRTSPYTELV